MKEKYDTPLKNADDYIARQPEEYRRYLEHLRAIIKDSCPDAEELISYQIICYKYHYMLVGIGTKQNYCSFYTMDPELLKQMKPELKNVKFSGATLHFPLNKPLPVDLIKRIIAQRVNENGIKAGLN